MPFTVKKMQNIISPPNQACLSPGNINSQNFDLTRNLTTSKYANVEGVSNSMIIRLSVSNRVSDNEIELTAEHMSYLGVVEGDSVTVERIPQDFYDLLPHARKIETFLYSAKYERTANARDIDPLIEPELVVKYLSETLKTQIFYQGQKIAFTFNGKDLMVVVDEIATSDYGDASSEKLTLIPRGELSNDTELTVTRFEKDRPIRPGVNPDEITKELYKRGIGGMSKIINELVESIFKVKCVPRDTKERLNVRTVKGVLFYGPPGTGKTLVARSLCELLLSVPPKVVSGPELVNKYVGQSEKNMRDLFEEAKKDYRLYGKRSPIHVFIFDEFESIAKKRSDDNTSGDHAERLVTQLLSLLDGVEELPNIFVMATTNRMHVIDSAMLRPGRIEKHVYVGYPSIEDRLDILQLKLKPFVKEELLDKDIDIGKIAALTEDFSGSDLESVVSGSFAKALEGTSFRDLSKLSGGKLGKITTSHMEQVVQQMKESKGADEYRFT